MEHRKNVFVVHGRNLQIQNAMFEFLKSLGLHPLDWDELVASTRTGTPYTGEILSKAFSLAQAVVVLMTPDDEGRIQEKYSKTDDPPYEKELTPQARLNVIFEAGMAMGRKPKRVIIVEIGDLRSFSDIVGRHTVRLDNTIEKRQMLVSRLKTAECDVDSVSSQWTTAGNFASSPSQNVPVDLKEPLEKNYLSVQRWLSQRRKNCRNLVNGDIPNKRDLLYAISEYSRFVGKDPDAIIADAETELRSGKIERHNQLVDDFSGSRTQGTAYSYQGELRSFYKHNKVTLTSPRLSYKPVRSEVRIPTREEIRKICDNADMRHKSWILANSYMGLDINKITRLKVEDFQTANWAVEKPIYPVHIGKSVNPSFEYTTFIGRDAKNLLVEYFAKCELTSIRRPWDFHRVSLTYAFKRYAYRAKVIEAPYGLNKDGVPKGLCALSTDGLKKRLRKILRESEITQGCYFHLLGIKRSGISDTNIPSYDALYDAYRKVEPKLRIY